MRERRRGSYTVSTEGRSSLNGEGEAEGEGGQEGGHEGGHEGGKEEEAVILCPPKGEAAVKAALILVD